MPDLYEQFDKHLNRLTDDAEVTSESHDIEPDRIISGSSVATTYQSIGVLQSGKLTFSNDENGYIIGVDEGVGKMYIGSTTSYFNFDGTDVSIAGKITATSGAIGGWSINSTSIYTGTEDHSGYTTNAGDLTIYSNGTDASIHGKKWYIDTVGALTCTGADITESGISSTTITGGSMAIGSDNSIFKADSNGIYLGHATFASAPFRVNMSGALVATSATIAGWTVDSTTISSASSEIVLDSANKKITVGSSAPITIDGVNKSIESDNYTSGVFGSGFHLDSDLLEVGNIACRGLIRTAVFQKDVVTVMGGNFAVLDGDVLDADMTADDNSTLTTKGTTTFTVGDFLRIKDGIDDEWMEVVAGTCDSYSEENQDIINQLSYSSNRTYTKIGQSFTGDGNTLNSCKFYISKFGSPTGNAVAKIYAHTGTFGSSGTPTGSALATSDNFDASTLTTDLALAIFTFTGAEKITLTNGTYYFVILEYSNGDGSNFIKIGIDNSSPTHNGNYAGYQDSWVASSSKDICFYVFTEGATASPYVVNRDKAGDYSTDDNPTWKKGATVVNYKQSGDGGVYMTASDTNAPYLSIFDHAGEPWDTINTRLRIGNLNGYLGYSTDLYGIAIGETEKYLKYDPTNGLRIKGDIIATSGTIGGFTLAADTLSSGTDSDYVGMSSAGTNAFWAGDSTFADAEFSVTAGGVLKATSATLTGIINATSGKFGTSTNHWLVGATGLTAVSASTDVIINYGKTDFGQDAINGFILGYDYSASKSKLEIGSSATKILKYDGTDLSLIGGTITSGIIRTAASGERVELSGSNNRIDIYDDTPTNIGYFGGVGNGYLLYMNIPAASGSAPIWVTSINSNPLFYARHTHLTTSNAAFDIASSSANGNVVKVTGASTAQATGSFVNTGGGLAMALSNDSSTYQTLGITQAGTNVCIYSNNTGAGTGISSSADSDASENTTGAALLVSQAGTTSIIATNVAGCYLTKGGTWTDTSSKSMKENFEDVSVLDKLMSLDIKKYNYISERTRNKEEIKERLIDKKKREKYSQTNEGQKGKSYNKQIGIKITTKELKEISSKVDKEYVKEQKRLVQKHISPMAEDMYKEFGVGDGVGLAAKDVAGIALQAIKELSKKVEDLEKK